MPLATIRRHGLGAYSKLFIERRPIVSSGALSSSRTWSSPLTNRRRWLLARCKPRELVVAILLKWPAARPRTDHATRRKPLLRAQNGIRNEKRAFARLSRAAWSFGLQIAGAGAPSCTDRTQLTPKYSRLPRRDCCESRPEERYDQARSTFPKPEAVRLALFAFSTFPQADRRRLLGIGTGTYRIMCPKNADAPPPECREIAT